MHHAYAIDTHKLLSLLALCLFLQTNAFSQKFSNEFLAIGVSARAHGMGGAMSAHVNDVTSGYWNPAGLASLQTDLQVSAMHAEWFAGIAQYDYLSAAKTLNPERKSVLGISVIRLGIDQIPNTLNLIEPDGTINYDNVTEFSAADYAFMGSYAQQLKNPNFQVGGSAKIIRRVIGSFGGAWGFGFDAGIQYQKGAWRFGLMARDITGTFNAWTFTLTDEEEQVFQATGNEIPESSLETTRPRFVLGSSWNGQLSEKFGILAALDLDFTTDGQRNVLISSSSVNVDPRLGVELDYAKTAFLRLGVNNFQEVLDDNDPTKTRMTFQPNFGIGLRLGRLQVDYALTDIGNVSEVLYSHVVSLTLDFKGK